MAKMVEIECCNCHVVFAITEEWQAALRKCHNWFYCPAGHVQHYTGESDEEKLKRELLTEQKRVADRQSIIQRLDDMNTAQRRTIRRLKKAILIKKPTKKK